MLELGETGSATIELTVHLRAHPAPGWLACRASTRHVMDGYHDEAVGVLAKDAAGRLAVTRVALRPQVRFSGEKVPGPEELRQLHDQAHHACFIANSVKTEVVVEPQ